MARREKLRAAGYIDDLSGTVLQRNMRGRDIVAIGGSAGGIAALKGIVAELPSNLDATLFVAVHSAAEMPGVLPSSLSKARSPRRRRGQR